MFDPRRDDLATLLAGAHLSEAGRTRQLIGRSWPGRPESTVPSAREWVRRWSPSRASDGVDVPACSCAGGCCEICN